MVRERLRTCPPRPSRPGPMSSSWAGGSPVWPQPCACSTGYRRPRSPCSREATGWAASCGGSSVAGHLVDVGAESMLAVRPEALDLAGRVGAGRRRGGPLDDLRLRVVSRRPAAAAPRHADGRADRSGVSPWRPGRRRGRATPGRAGMAGRGSSRGRPGGGVRGHPARAGRRRPARRAAARWGLRGSRQSALTAGHPADAVGPGDSRREPPRAADQWHGIPRAAAHRVPPSPGSSAGSADFRVWSPTCCAPAVRPCGLSRSFAGSSRWPTGGGSFSARRRPRRPWTPTRCSSACHRRPRGGCCPARTDGGTGAR